MQNLVLTTKGLHTYNNYFSEVPNGALTEALNVIIDRDGVIEPRRGLFQYGDELAVTTERVSQLINYKDRLLRHTTGSQLAYDNGSGTFTNFSGTFSEIEPGLRIKSIESNGNLYFTTSEGIKKLSATSASQFSSISPIQAGGVKALNLSAAIDYTTPGFLTTQAKVAYSVVWGFRDINDNLILGTPSARVVVENISATDSCIVKLTFSVPDAVTSTSYFYQVYRTAIVPNTTDPGQEFNLVIEDFVTSAQITAGVVSNLEDVTPDDFRASGTPLYTNPVSGDGIEQANDAPPFAKDIALFNGITFYANTKTIQRLNLSQISIENLISGTSSVSISDGTTTRTYTYQGTIETFTADFTGCALTDLYNAVTGPAKYFTITSSSDERSYYVWYYRTASDEDPLVTGKLGIKVDISAAATLSDAIDITLTAIDTATGDFNITRTLDVLTIACSNNGFMTTSPTETISGPFAISTDGLGTGEDASTQKILLPRIPGIGENGPTTAQQIELASQSLINVINQDNSGLVYAFYLSGATDVPGEFYLEQRTITGLAFFVTADTSTTGADFNPTLPISGSTVISSNEVRPNRLYYSKYQQPEAVPLLNYVDIGPKDQEIKRIISLREGLFVFKPEGVYRISGTSSPFIPLLFDNSVSIIAPDSATVLNNQIYALTDQGVVSVSDTGVAIISRPIYDKLIDITRSNYNYKFTTFGVAYRSDNSYLLCTVSTASDNYATQIFRYNTFTNSWTRWEKDITCGIINSADNKLYFGSGDIAYIEKERKSLDASDYCDREYSKDIITNGIVDNVIQLNNLTNVNIGDVLQQTQYLTVAQFNRVLKKLDTDPQVSDTDYFSSLEFLAGEDPRNKISTLAVKLDADTGISDNDYSTVIASKSGIGVNAAISGIQTEITDIGHGLEVGRYITISNSTTTPSINETYRVVQATANTFKIDATITVAGTLDYTTPINDFRDIQGCFNIAVNKLNNDPGVFYTNYPDSEGTIQFKVIISSKDTVNSKITAHISSPFIAGPSTVFSAIQTDIVWAPQFFGDPSTMKQVSEGTFMFQDKNFNDSTVSYASDLNPSYSEINVNGSGYGDFGEFNWSEQYWGGVAAPTPIRTFVPKEKQRCRFIRIRFEHQIAYEKYSLYGVSLKFRAYSTKAYR